jgi:NitT/TauT family transport system substrate-binding protein
LVENPSFMRRWKMSKRTFFRVALISVLVLCLAGQAFAGGGQRQREGELPVIRVAVMPWLLSLPAVYVAEQGWDVENGFKVELSTYPMGAPLLEAMGANLWDVATIGPAAVFSVANTGLKIIGNISIASGGTGAFIRPDHPAARIRGQISGYPEVYGNAAALRGSRVLVPVGSLNHFNVQKWMDVIGVRPDEIQVVHMDNAASFQAFKTGQGDITAFSPPLSYTSEAEGWVKGAGLPELNIEVYDCLYANPRLYNQKKDLIAKFVRQFYRACDFLAANQDFAAQMNYEWQNKNGLNATRENARDEVRVRPYMTSERARREIPGESMKMMAEFYALIGTLEREKLANFNSETMTREIIDLAFR